MSKIEFLQMVPALLFGISLAELALFLGKASNGSKKLYWEHLVLIAISFESIIFNWYIFYDRMIYMEASYINFLIQLLSPLASFVYVANLVVNNDDPDKPLEVYFQKRRKRIFLSLALFAVINIMTVFYFNPSIRLGLLPIIPVSLILINAFYDIKWLRIVAYIFKTAQVVVACFYFS